MLLFWKIRYLDRSTKEFEDRNLYLNTNSLDPVTRAIVELVARNESLKRERDILKYRHLFREEEPGMDDPGNWNEIVGVGPSEYFEDETGKEVTLREMGPLLTGNPDAMHIPRGARPHDIELMVSERTPIPVQGITLTEEEVELLGYFSRDLNELLGSTFRKDKPGTLSMTGGAMLTPDANPRLSTPATDDEIRSFVMIFRRLYMEKEPANFEKAVAVFVKAIGDNPYAKWVAAGAAEYERHLNTPPDVFFLPPATCTFTVKRLIDVFLYTQYAHQPKDNRPRQFDECLRQVHGKQAVLTWLFLTELSRLSGEIGSAGKVIAGWFKHYCASHGITPNVLGSLRGHHPGLGGVEKDEARRDRLFREQSEQLAADLWMQAGRPAGGPSQFFLIAQERLTVALRGEPGDPSVAGP